MKRPYLDEFLTAAYEHYDIAIWSATNMKWIELKMAELGVANHANFKPSFYVCHQGMITIHTEKHGVVNVKPLALIWGNPLFAQWNETNTIMIDDLRRNFLMNPAQGLRIRAFRNAPVARATDDELKHLARYLQSIADVDDFRTLDHRAWCERIGRT